VRRAVGGWPVRAARDGAPPSAILIRVSAAPYDDDTDIERLTDALATR